jgi:hypothetical protein
LLIVIVIVIVTIISFAILYSLSFYACAAFDDR